MFKTTSALSVLSGLLLVAACGRPAAPALRDGSVEFVLGGSTAANADDAMPGRLTITSLDRSFRTQVELSSSVSSGSVSSSSVSSHVRVELPPGLYAVDAAASTSADEPVIPALSAPQLVVVAAGQVSTVNVLVTGVEQPAVAALVH
jgi:hypothetical protein